MAASPQPKRILIRGVNWLGDAVMTTPALLRLREARPDAHITLLTHAKLKDLWRHHPAIDAVETFTDADSVFAIGKRLRTEKFDLGLVLPNSPRSALELWLAGIPQRVGYLRAWRNWMLTQAVAPRAGAVKMHKRSVTDINQLIRENVPPQIPPTSAHHIFQYLHLTTVLGANPAPLAPKLSLADGAIDALVTKFKLPTQAGTIYLGLNAGAEYGPAKRWPEELFIEAAIHIQQRIQCRWLILGIKSDNEMASRIAAKISAVTEQPAGKPAGAERPRVFNLAGATSLGELCAALKLCRVVLTNDSGPMHVAAALGTPVVVPFGSTSPELTGPGLPGDSRNRLLDARVACSPCFLRECPIDFRCMKNIPVAQVVASVLGEIK